MKKILVRGVAAAVLSVAVFASFGYCQSADDDGGMPVFDESTKNINVRAGQTFIVMLDANHTTGYQWRISKPLNEAVVKYTGSEYLAPENPKAGAGGQEMWTFTCMGAGSTHIVMEYARPSDKSAKPAKTFDTLVTAK